jgi:hypothetical protein
MRYFDPLFDKMKSRATLFVLLFSLVLIAFNAESQRIRGGFAFGFNATQVDGDEIFGFRKYGIHAGAVGTLPLRNNFLFSLETLYSQKGANQPNRTAYYRQYRVDLDYVEVPFMLQYNDKDMFTVGAGFAFSRLIGVKEWEKGERTTTTLFGENAHFDRADYMALIDLKFRIVQRLSMNVRYQYSLDKIRLAQFSDDFQQKKWERKQYNNQITFRLAYMFNEPLPVKDE